MEEKKESLVVVYEMSQFGENKFLAFHLLLSFLKKTFNSKNYKHIILRKIILKIFIIIFKR